MRARHRLAGSLLLALASALALVGCNTASPPAASKLPAPPLPTSFTAGGAEWAIVPMGHLYSRPNTFWQLFVKRPGSSRFVLDTPKGVGDNGGLVGDAVPNDHGAGTPQVVIGFLASNLLGFSPFATTADAGTSWTGGVLPTALTAVPSSLVTVGPRRWALFGRADKAVLESSSPGGWHEVTRLAQLAKSGAGRRCGLAALTALGSGSGDLLLGGECTKPGATGLFAESRNGWRLVSPGTPLPRSSVSEVLAVEETASGRPAVLVLEEGASRSRLVVLQESSSAWRASSGLALAPGESLQSAGASPQGLFALLRTGSLAHPRQERLEVLSEEGWRLVARPPAGTETVAWSGASLEALAVSNSLLTVSDLRGGSWSEVERLLVPIQYGSAG